MTSSAGVVADLQDTVRSGVGWLLERLAGGLDSDVVPYVYRVPLAYALAGRRSEASAVLTWMDRAVVGPTGDLQGPMGEASARAWSSYPLAIITQAAWHLERYALAARTRSALTRYQDQRSGGAYAERPDVRRGSRQDLFPTAQLGLTALTVGDDAMADGAARWLTALWEMQPELPHRLYTATTGDRLLTDARAVAADPFGTVTEFGRPRQAFYNPGIAAAFLARFAARRADPPARHLAKRYLELTVAGGEHQFDHTDSVQVCKFGWGAAALLDLDPAGPWRAHAERMAAWFRAAQHPDGHWENSAFLLPPDCDRAGHGSSVEVTAEFVQHVSFLGAALAHADAYP